MSSRRSRPAPEEPEGGKLVAPDPLPADSPLLEGIVSTVAPGSIPCLLAALTDNPHMAVVCEGLGLTRFQVMGWMRSNTLLEEAIREAQEAGREAMCDRLEQELCEVAEQGALYRERRVSFEERNGQHVVRKTGRRRSITALTAYLAAYRPKHWGTRRQELGDRDRARKQEKAADDGNIVDVTPLEPPLSDYGDGTTDGG